MDLIIVLAVLALVVLFVSAPLRRVRQADSAPTRRLADLEAAREAKYREIRDAELDHRTGKLSDADYASVDGTLRAEAIEILHAIDEAGGGAGERALAGGGAGERAPVS